MSMPPRYSFRDNGGIRPGFRSNSELDDAARACSRAKNTLNTLAGRTCPHQLLGRAFDGSATPLKDQLRHEAKDGP